MNLRTRVGVVCCALALGAVSCKGVKNGAREEFGKKYSCPEDGVTVTPRGDLDPNVVFAKPKTRSKRDEPPAEVAADPARLAKWNADRAEKEASRSERYSGYDMFEISGCNHKDLAACRHPVSSTGRGGTSTDMGRVSCMFTTAP